MDILGVSQEKSKVIPLQSKTGSVSYITYTDDTGKVFTYEDVFKTIAISKRSPESLAWRNTLLKSVEDLATVKEPPNNPVKTPKKYKLDEVIKLLKEYDIKTRKFPILIPNMTDHFDVGPFPTRQSIDLFIEEIDTEGTIIQKKDEKQLTVFYYRITFPYPSTKKGSRIPVYNPSFSVVGYNREYLMSMYERLSMGSYGGQAGTNEALKVYQEMCQVARTWYYGSGTLKGMLNRYKIMSENQVQAAATRSRHNIDFSKLCMTLKRWIKRDGEYILFDLNVPILRTLMKRPLYYKGEPIKWGIKINTDANPGPLYYNIKYDGRSLNKGDVVFPEFYIATNIMKSLHKGENIKVFPTYTEAKRRATRLGLSIEEVKREGKQMYKLVVPQTTVTIIDDFWQKYEFLRVAILFPKSDPYEVQKREEKTRIIAAFSSPITYPAQIMLTPFLKTLLNSVDHPAYFIPDKGLVGGTLSCLGFSPYTGGMSKIIKIIEDLYTNREGGTCFISVYADNIYVARKEVDKVIWMSIDLEKSESRISYQLTQAMATVVCLSYPNVSQGWLTYAQHIYPESALNSTGLLFNQQFPYPWLGSGAPGTHLLNTAASVELITTAAENVMETGNTPYEFMYRIVNEKSIPSLPLEHAMNRTGVKCVLEQYSVWPLPPEENLFKMDMLGFDAVRFRPDEGSEIWIPVLDKERMYKCILLHKNYYDSLGKPLLSRYAISYLEVIKYRAIMFLGAWTQITLFRDVYNMAKKHLFVLKNLSNQNVSSKVEPIKALTEFMKEFNIEEEWVTPIISIANKLILPTLYEMIMLYTGDEEIAIKSVKSRVGTVPPSLLVPPNLYDLVGMESKNFTAPEAEELEEQSFDWNVLNIPVGREPILMVEKKKIFTKTEIPQHSEKGVELLQTATKDVGTPIFPAKPKNYKYLPNRLNLFIDKFDPNYYYIYRIPVAERYIHRLSEIKNERFVAMKAIVKGLMVATSMDEEVIYREVKKLMAHVAFILRPLTKAQGKYPKTGGGLGTYDSPYYTDFETINLALRPQYIYAREFDSRDISLKDYGTPWILETSKIFDDT